MKDCRRGQVTFRQTGDILARPVAGIALSPLKTVIKANQELLPGRRYLLGVMEAVAAGARLFNLGVEIERDPGRILPGRGVAVFAFPTKSAADRPAGSALGAQPVAISADSVAVRIPVAFRRSPGLGPENVGHSNKKYRRQCGGRDAIDMPHNIIYRPVPGKNSDFYLVRLSELTRDSDTRIRIGASSGVRAKVGADRVCLITSEQ